jgi:hypothetical protein
MCGGANVRNQQRCISRQGSLKSSWKWRSTFGRTILWLFIGLVAHLGWAQGSGRFYGAVTDNGGSAVAGAKV